MHPSFLTTPRRRRVFIGALAAVVLLASVVVVGRLAIIHPRHTTTAIGIDSGMNTCGDGWTSSHGGPLDFAVHNTTIASEEVYLQGASDARVYGELEGLGAGATHHLEVVLADGRYRFVCLPSDATVAFGPVVTVSGAAQVKAPTPGIQTVTAVDLIGPTKQYHDWVQGRMPVLLADVRSLDSAVDSDDLALARTTWLAAHLEYESLGAAYGTFGALDDAIDGTPVSGTTSLTDPQLSGFHRIEGQLWSGAPSADIRPFTDRLVSDVAALQTAFTTAQIPALDIGLRAHEILENAIQFELTGSTDAGSGTTIATIGANLDGTRQALAPLEPLLNTRYAHLDETLRWLDRSSTLVASYRRADGSWTPLAQLSTAQREFLDSALGETVELLAPVAAITDPRPLEQ